MQIDFFIGVRPQLLLHSSMLLAKNVLLLKSRANKSPIDFEREQIYLLASYRLQSYAIHLKEEAKANREVHLYDKITIRSLENLMEFFLQVDIKLLK